MQRSLLLLACITLSFSSLAQVGNLIVKWGVIENNYCQKELTLSEFTFQNDGSITLKDENWAFYFNYSRPILVDSMPPGVKITHLNGDFYKLEPSAGFLPIQPGKSNQVRMVSRYQAIMLSDFPRGGYFLEKGKLIPVKVLVDIPESPAQIMANATDKRPVETAALRYVGNEQLSLLPAEQLPPCLPTPFQYSYGQGSLILSSPVIITCSAELTNEAGQLQGFLRQQGFVSIIKTGNAKGKNVIRLVVDNKVKTVANYEAYKLSINSLKGIEITSPGPEGVFYGIQSLKSIILKNKASLPDLEITDAPRFPYRGVMLDVARNFQTKETVKQLLDRMAMYKFNKFHFHLTDDEGWRVEINGLPELTSYGAFRGHTEDESDYLQPSYGSGPFAVQGKSSGCGFYNRSSFIEILRYAAERHIEVIPEIDFPGHARAAIKAMDYRYRKLMAQGRVAEAEEYLLRDTADRSVYSSAQYYDDNVVCVCRESVYHFLRKVTQELSNMYRDAGLTLKTIHIGGDEVPSGAWEQSPLCRGFLANHPEYPDKQSLERYFVRRFNEILMLRNITTAGWEEIALAKVATEGSIRLEANTELADRGLSPFCRNSLWGGGSEDISYKLANDGFNTVLANATNLYLDMAYCKDPHESGSYMANFINTRTVFGFTPTNIPCCATVTKFGDTISISGLKDRFTYLSDIGKRNIKGMEACLGGENSEGVGWVEYMLFPRLLAVAERAWGKMPDWESIPDSVARTKVFMVDYNCFANMLGQRELPMLERIGIRFRIPLPGVVTRNGMINANVEFPGLPIRFTTDGKTPGLDSQLYIKPISISGQTRFSTLLHSGRSSRVVKP